MAEKSKRGNRVLCSLLALSLFLLSSCSSDSSQSQQSNNGGNSTTNSENSGEKVTLTLWHYYNGTTKDALDVLISQFNATTGAEKNIAVESYSYSSVSDLATAVVDSANKEVGMSDLPDIFAAYSDTALLLNDMGMVAAMDPYFSQAELSLFQQDFLNEGRFGADGNLKIIPVAKSTELLFVNQTDFQVFSNETGVTLDDLSTWEDLAETAEIYYNWTDAKTPEEYDGSALFGVDSEANFMLIAAKQMGEEMYDYGEDGVRFGLSEESASKIWETMIVPYIREYYSALGSYRSDDVKSGDILIYTGSTSSVYYFPSTVELGRAEAYDITGVAMPYPYFSGKEKVVVQQGAGMVVSKSDETTEAAAAEFLKWFTSAEINLEFAVTTGYIPVQNDAMTLDGVLNVMEETIEGEIADIVLSTAEVTYDEVLPSYEFYSNEPFDGSYDTRNAVRDSMQSVVTEATAQLRTRVADGESREEVLMELTGEESFLAWYTSLDGAISDILAEK